MRASFALALLAAAACDHSASAPVAPPGTDAATASAQPVDAAPPGKGPGSFCSASSECNAALECCATGMTGHCGGAPPGPGVHVEPCVTTKTCVRGPCRPLLMPP